MLLLNLKSIFYFYLVFTLNIYLYIQASKAQTHHISLVNAIKEAKKIEKEESILEKDLEHIRHNLKMNKKKAQQAIKREYSSSSESSQDE
jgi:hypothetical protein